MLIANGDGTYTAGPLDVMFVLHDVAHGTYHAAFFEEAPMPGPIADATEVEVVRLRSKFHHTAGAPDLAGAQVHLDEMLTKITVPESNFWRDHVVAWDGELGVTLLEANWRRAS